MVKVEFFGKAGFLNLTEHLRTTLKTSEKFEVKTHLNSSHLLKTDEGYILITGSKPNKAELQNGLINIAEKEPDFVRTIEPQAISRNAFVGRVILSNKRPSLQEDLQRLIESYLV